MKSLLAVGLILATLLGGPVRGAADELDEIDALVGEQQYSEALVRLQSYLNRQPMDARARFLKGLILTEQREPDKAIEVFTSLTRDYPALPEPYNNLAVLYADQGKYEQARQSLLKAIQTHPSYATAHENLGDIYTKLASQAYTKALQLNKESGKDNPVAQAKLSLVRKIFVSPPTLAKGDEGKVVPTPVAALTPAKPADTAKAEAARAAAAKVEAAKAEAARAEAAKVEAARAETAKVEAARAETAKVDAARVEAARAEVAKAEAAKAEAARVEAAKAEAAKADPEGGRKEVEQAVRQWADAWSGRNAERYLASYAADFVPSDGLALAAWKQMRRERLIKARFIRVELAHFKVDQVGKEKARVSFLQKYQSDNYHDEVNKSLLLKLEKGAWKIEQELAQ